MTDEKLDSLLNETFNQEIKAPAGTLYKAHYEATRTFQKKEAYKEYYPILIVLLMHTIIVLTCGIGFILLSHNLKLIAGVIAIMFVLINLPIGAYTLIITHCKEQEIYKYLEEER